MFPTGVRWTRLGMAAVPALLFLALSLVVETRGALPGDERALVELYETFGTDLDDVMVGIGDATDTIPVAVTWAVVVGWFHRTGRTRHAAVFFLVVVVAMAGNRGWKELFARPRPDVRLSPESLSTFTFPSGHASNSAAIFGALLLVTPAARRAPVVATGLGILALVGFSRLAIGVHYPSDLLAGWLWVASWTLLVWWWQGDSLSDAARRGDRTPP